MRARVALALGAALALACAGDGSQAPAGDDPHALPPRPMGRAAFPRSGHLTYQLSTVERDGDQTRVDLVFTNGTSRNYEAVLVQVVAVGAGGERETVDSPLGPMRRGATKRHRVYFESLGFRLDDVLIDVIYTHP